ncbi:hypothetical protein PIB30_041122 [Stylosanthes scabra]|uniref:Cytochrome P450 n=1 Tax=Stylosanthes scabra TaxID=79078 RepID=A0ABU6RFE6_9FABA|nr:hypothetical protein [Stylosanthes scabra]
MYSLVGSMPHEALRNLASKYGPLMHLKLGEISNIIVSSPEMAQEIMKTQDLNFCDRPNLLFTRIWAYNRTSIAFGNYGDYWRHVRKICTMELLTAKRVQSFRHIREKEVSELVKAVSESEGSIFNLTQKIFSMIYGIAARAAFVDVLLKFQEKDSEYPLTDDNIKAVIQEMFIGGGETTSSVVDWAMAEMIKKPKVMERAQAEVRRVYVPRENKEPCLIKRYQIPANSRIVTNAWAIGRDPKYWVDAESFMPERFLDSSIDYRGINFELIPFGAGRRICPGITFATPIMELPLAQFLYYFDWKLPNGMNNEELDMTELYGLTIRRRNDLCLIPIIHHQP